MAKRLSVSSPQTIEEAILGEAARKAGVESRKLWLTILATVISGVATAALIGIFVLLWKTSSTSSESAQAIVRIEAKQREDNNERKSENTEMRKTIQEMFAKINRIEVLEGRIGSVETAQTRFSNESAERGRQMIDLTERLVKIQTTLSTQKP